MATKKALGRSECAHSEHEIIMEANANCEVDEAKRLLCNHLHEVMMTHVTVKKNTPRGLMKTTMIQAPINIALSSF